MQVGMLKNTGACEVSWEPVPAASEEKRGKNQNKSRPATTSVKELRSYVHSAALAGMGKGGLVSEKKPEQGKPMTLYHITDIDEEHVTLKPVVLGPLVQEDVKITTPMLISGYTPRTDKQPIVLAGWETDHDDTDWSGNPWRRR